MESTSTHIDAPLMAGISALLIWAISATLLAGLTDIPALEGLVIVLSTACIASICRLSFYKKWHTLKTLKPMPSLLMAMGLMGNHTCYYLAFHYAPAVEVDIVAYSWPLIGFLILILKGQTTFQYRSLLILLMGFGALILISPGLYPVSGYPHIALGWMIAGMGALCWIIYAIGSQESPNAPIEMVGLYAGITVLLALLCTDYSTWVTPNTGHWLRLITLGLASATYAYWAWDYALKKGKLAQLLLCANTTPVLSVWLLCFFGYAHWSWSIGLASVLLVASLFLIGKVGRRSD